MKKFFLFITVLLIGCGLFVHLVTLPKLKENIQNQFKSAGFSNAEIEDVHYTIDGLNISKIYLDKEKFSHAENLQINLFWPLFILKSEIHSLVIQKLQIVTTPQEIYREIATLKPRSIENWPNTNIYNLIIDIATRLEPIRINGKLLINQEDSLNNISLNLSAAQNNLSFKSQINGSITDNSNFILDGNFSELMLNIHPISLSRAHGWLSVENINSDFDVSAELNAGSGKIFKLPLQSISITAAKQDNNFPVILRSNISGNEATGLSADIDFAKKIEHQNFNVRFKSDDFQKFLEYLIIQEIIDTDNLTAMDFDKLLLEAQFLKERRFADGPWPFELTASNQSDKEASGIFLLYPDKFDLRGSAQGDREILTFLNRLIDGDEIDGDILRVEENLKNHLVKN